MPASRPSIFKRILRFVLPVGVLSAAVGGAMWMVRTAPQAKPRPALAPAALVDVLPVSFGRQGVMIEAQGTVVPARRITLAPRVTGEIVQVAPDFVPGGLFRSGDLLLKIDPADYELAIPRAEGALAEAESALRTEEGNQAIAKKDYEVLGQKIPDEDRALVLRQPQLASARAAVASAKADVERARLDLERTTMTAPFNAVIESRNADLGARVGANSDLSTLTGTDTFWVELSLRVSHLRWLDIPRNGERAGSPAVIHDEAWGPDATRSGTIVRMAASLETQGRMARVFVAVEDPLSLLPENADKPAMIAGSYVTAFLTGLPVESAAAIPREYVHDGDHVWIITADNTLEIRKVDIAFSGEDTHLVTGGLSNGERIVTTNLPAPVPGMALRAAAPATADGPDVAGTPKSEPAL